MHTHQTTVLPPYTHTVGLDTLQRHAGICFDDAGVYARTQHFIEQPAKQIAVPKTAVSIFGKGRVIGDFIFKA